MSKAAISLIQTGLRDLGYDPGQIDGVFGGKTGGAAQSWLAAGGAAVHLGLKSETTAMIYQGAARYPVREIVLHCSDTRPDWMASAGLAAQVAEIRRWHVQDRGWKDIGYHWIIGRDGKVLSGRSETTIGAGVEGHNSGVIHAVLIGGHQSSENDRFDQHFTPAQNITVRQVIQGISMRTQIKLIAGHNDYAAKACPGFRVSTWLKEAA